MKARTQYRSWMHALCRPGSKLAAPFRASYQGEQWDVASNGQALLLMRGPCVFAEPSEPIPIDHALRQDGDVKLRPAVPFEMLREWLFATERCTECGGTGELPFEPLGSYLCGCEGGFRRAHGTIFGRTIDRWLAWRYLQMLHTDRVDIRVGSELEPVLIVAPDWIVAVMPLRSSANPVLAEEDAKIELPEFWDYLRPAMSEALEGRRVEAE